MDGAPSQRGLDFYKNSPRGQLLRAMTLSDILFWGADSFISVVLILYVINFIDGGSATHLGLAFLVYKGVAALASFPVGRFFDKHSGFIDEVWGLAFASFATGAVYVGLAFSTTLWQLYVALFLLGFISIINLTSWRTLFYSHIQKNEYSQTLGMYQTFFFLCQGVAIALGGLIGDSFGFQAVVLYGGILIALGGMVPLSIRYLFAKK